MSTELQEAMKLIRDMAPMMDPEEDYITIAATEQQTSTTKANRKKELEEAQSNLKGAPPALSRVLDSARTSATRPSTVPTAAEHRSTINELDATRLSLAKAINDAESSLASREAELASLKEEARVLEECDPAAEHERELNGTALRLQIYKGMGFEPIADKDGRLTKMLVRAESGDVHCVSFDDHRKSNAEYADLLWKLASS